jgi:hypothetical protein
MLNNNSMMDEVTPLQFRLSQNYPNPFKEKTMIKYCIAYKTRVKLTVYNSEGEEVQKLVDEEKKPGAYEIEFFASSCHSRESGNPIEGTYFYRLEADNYRSEKTMLLQN